MGFIKDNKDDLMPSSIIYVEMANINVSFEEEGAGSKGLINIPTIVIDNMFI